MPLTQRFSIALLSASSITLALCAAFALHLERPYWAGIAAMVLSQSEQGQSLEKGIWRMVGTVAGALAGMAVLARFGESRAALLVACGVSLALLVVLMHGSRYAYFYYSTALMLVLVAAQSHSEAPFRIAVARMQENLVGIAAYTLCALCLRPHSAAREFHRLPAFGRGVFRELADHFDPTILRGKLRAGAAAFLQLALLTALWQNLPDAPGSLFIEIGALLILLGAMTGHFAAWSLIAAFAVGIPAALWLYGVLPRLAGWEELAALTFAAAFSMAWILPRPEQGMARMGVLMPVFVLSGLGGEVFGPESMLNGAAGLLCAALAVSLIFQMTHGPDVPGSSGGTPAVRHGRLARSARHEGGGHAA